MKNNNEYQSTDLTIVVPTRNRPQKLRRLLDSIIAQTKPVKQVVVVSSGNDIGYLFEDYKKTLDIVYKHELIGGQIHQRNVAIGLVNSGSKLIATLDDDIVLLPDAVENMISFWNQTIPETAGVGFNIINEKPYTPNTLLTLLRLSDSRPGRVLRSGACTSIANVKEDIRTQWLNGGATVWKKDILDKHPHDPVKSRWAVAEDLIFSFPIGHLYPLFVCVSAQVRHEHAVDQFPLNRAFFLRGKNVSLWHLYFVQNNRDLKIGWFIWHFSVLGFLFFIRGIFQNKTNLINFGVGIIFGLSLALYRFIIRKEVLNR